MITEGSSKMDKHISMDTARDILAEHYGSASPETEAVLLKIWDELDGAASDELSRQLEDLQRENAYLEQERAALWRWHDQREEKNRWRCQVGDTVWFPVIDDENQADNEVEGCPVTEVGSRGFWTADTRGDITSMNAFTPWEELGQRVFLTRQEAEAARKFYE